MPVDFTPQGTIPISHRRPVALNRFWFGSTYYPEHWDAEVRATDAERMAEAGFNVVRMAEFAWDLMEPVEGTFDFSLFDETIQALGEKGIHTILCTPTAAPPRWLTLKHPDTLRVERAGVPMQHGSRQHCCHASETFREYSRRITRAMAEHFKGNPFVPGWQTDNEFHCHFSECHCPNCHSAFPRWLKAKYGDIESLNRAWGTAFWAQTYDRFEDIPTPKVGRPAHHNPAQELDYHRYLSDTVANFQHDQVAILKETNSAWWVTHNGFFRHIDNRGPFMQDLDVPGYDSYPFFSHDPQQRRKHHAFNLDRARSYGGNFMILEQQAGPGGQPTYMHDTPEPGEMRRMAFTSVARGSDSLLHFRWRTCRYGAEGYWCGILDHDNVPRRRYEECCREGKDFAAVGPEILGTSVHIDCAVAASDMHVNDAHDTYTLGLPSHQDVAATVHNLLFDEGYATGIVHPSDDLSGIKLYVVPHWALFDPAWVPNLEKFVRDGGTLVIGARTATRGVDNAVVAETLPGCLRELCGMTVEEYGRQNNPSARPISLVIDGVAVQTDLWYEVLQPEGDTRPLATWQGRHLDGACAATVREVGKGKVVYVGTYLTPEVAEILAKELVDLSGLEPLWPDAPLGVEVVRRENGEKRIWFFINHRDEPVTMKRSPDGFDLITGAATDGGEILLEVNGVAVVREE